MNYTDEQIEAEFMKLVETANSRKKDIDDITVNMTAEVDDFIDIMAPLFEAFTRSYPSAEDDQLLRSYVDGIFSTRPNPMDVAREVRPIRYMQALFHDLALVLKPAGMRNFYSFHITYGGLILRR